MLTKFEQRSPVTLENQGEKIFGILHLPVGVESCPAVLMCHGLAGNRTGRSRQYVILSEKLAEKGIASLRFDFRGSGDSEGYLSEMTLHGEISDSLCALEFFANHPQIDSERVGIFGRSLGGLVAIMSAKRYGGVKSLATWAALFDGHQWRKVREKALNEGLSDEVRIGLTSFNGQTPSDEFFEELFQVDIETELSDLHHIPLLNIHGENDPVVTLDHSKMYKKARQNSQGITEFLHLPTDEHEFSLQPSQNIAIEKTCEWFVNTL